MNKNEIKVPAVIGLATLMQLSKMEAITFHVAEWDVTVGLKFDNGVVFIEHLFGACEEDMKKVLELKM